jgi:hypothetical protein
MSTNHPKQYIVEQDSQSQESVATRYLVEEPLSRERLLAQLGLSEFCWMILELRLEKLVPDISGEIDILAGTLSWRDPAAFAHAVECERTNLPPNSHPSWAVRIAMSKIAISGGIAWPPPVDYLGGIEVKRAYRDTNGKLRAKKGSKVRDLHKQLKRDLFDLSLDCVALVDIIAHHPATGTGSGAWLAAGELALDSLRAMEPILRERLNKNGVPVHVLLPVGHLAWAIGSVEGGDETIRGASTLAVLSEAKANPFREQRNRVLEERLLQILSNVPTPSTWPFIMKDCRSCDQIHVADGLCRMAQNRRLR